MPFVLGQTVRTPSAPYCYQNGLFTPEECDRIIALSETLPREVAKTGLSMKGVSTAIESDARRADVYWVPWNEAVTWIFERLAGVVVPSNDRWWGYHLSSLSEPLQLTHYREDVQGHYDWHEDHGDDGTHALRKLSVVVQLNEGFEGGDFELLRVGRTPELERGAAIMFPSFRTHRVLPVTKGDRWSLVCWVSGTPFV